MIENTYEFYQLIHPDVVRTLMEQNNDEVAAHCAIRLREYHLSYSEPLSQDDTIESITHRLRHEPPADFLCDYDAGANLIFVNRDGVRRIYFCGFDLIREATEVMEHQIAKQGLYLPDGIVGLWELDDSFCSGDDTMNVLAKVEHPLLHRRLLTDSSGNVLYRITQQRFDSDVTELFKAHSLKNGATLRELTHISANSTHPVISPDGGLWTFKGLIRVYFSTVYLMQNVLYRDFFVISDRNGHILATLDELGIDQTILETCFDTLYERMDTESEEDTEECFDLEDELTNADEEMDVSTEQRRSFIAFLRSLLLGFFRRKQEPVMDEQTIPKGFLYEFEPSNE